MGSIRARVPDATLLIVGGGPYEAKLRAMATAAPADSVLFAGEVSEHDLPGYYAVGDVFAMPCRTRAAGLEVEGWGNVFIEAAACARPVVVGDSGGAPEALIDGETGLCVDGRRVDAVADAVATLLADPGLARKMGEAGRARVVRVAYVAGDRRPAGRMAPRRGGLRVVRRVSFEGYPSAVPDEERRCPNCGALVSEDAAWCGQCFTPAPSGSRPSRRPATGGTREGRPPSSPPPNRRNGPCRSGRARCVAGRTRSSWIRVRRAARRSRR